VSERPAARLVLRWYHVAPVVLALGLLAAWAVSRAWTGREPPVSAPLETVEPSAPAAEPARGPDPTATDPLDFPKQPVTLYWPRADGAGLVATEAEIFATQQVTDRAKQVIGLLLRGPEADEDSTGPASADESQQQAPGDDQVPAGEELLSPLPPGTALRSAFVDDAGTGWFSFSEELVRGAPGGSSWELQAAHAVVNSLTRSLPEIRRVRLLVEGREVETLSGHLDLRHPLGFNERVLAPEEAP
jgi:spore germination protein GerM